ncbi:exosome complex component RRP43-like isoform X2 [Lycorma delicatula]|uniref:exosome complex component RRP43-like isoform X2 n=1 Tax=Lycorma delicatula TaxID=130591 RepID=UPI003F51A12B
MDDHQYRKIHPVKFYREYLAHDIRPDGRKLMKVRPATMNVGSISTAEGSAVVKIGSTTVICGIKAELCQPRAEAPGEGFLVTNLDYPPLCSSKFRPGPPSDEGQSETSLITEIINSCEIIDLESLCIHNEKLVWVLFCDVICLDYNGCIIDAALAAIVAALKIVKLPEVIYNEETSSTIVNDKNLTSLNIKCAPVATSFAVFVDNIILADPTQEEERLSSGGRITVVTDGRKLYSVHKPGGSSLSESELQMCINLANGRAEQMNKLIETAINTPEK